MSNVIEQSFKINITVLTVLGLYPSENASLVRKLYGFGLYILLLILPAVLGIRGLLLEGTSDIVEMNFMVMYFSALVVFSLKVLPFLTNGKRIKKCINYFGHPRFVPTSHEERKITDECIHVCQRNSKVYFYGLTVGAIVWILQGVLSGGDFPITVWLPYNPLSNSLVYYTTFSYYAAVIVYDTFACAITDPLLGGLTYLATCQLKILKYNLNHLDKYVQGYTAGKGGHSFIKFKDVQETLTRCIDFHNNILEFVAEYEECFSWPTFFQFVESTLTICFSLIGYILGSSTTMAITKDIVCSVCPMAQIFFYCYYGTLLYEENNGLVQAIYMGPWYRYDVRIRKTLITIMERSKQPMIITFGKVVNLTLATFVSVLKTSYSLIAILNNY